MADSQQDVDAARRELESAYQKAASDGSISGGSTAAGVATEVTPTGWSPELVAKLSLGMGIFAVLSFACVTVLIFKRRNAEQVLRTFGILVIIFAAVFLVVAGYSDTQITPVIGLLGTIAGYLLGRRIEPTAADRETRSERRSDTT